MLVNRYLRKLIATYSESAIGEHNTDDTVEQAAAVILQSFKQLGMDIDKMPDEVLMYYILNLYGQLSGASNIINPRKYEKAAVDLAQELKSTELNLKEYRYSYGKHGRSFSSGNIFDKVMKAAAIASMFFESLPFFKLNAAEINSYIAANPKVVVNVMEKSLIEQSLSADNSRREGVIIKYTPEKYIQNIPPHAAPAVSIIKSTIESKAQTSVRKIYERFREAGALTPLPENSSLDVTTILALRIYWSAQHIYHKFLNKGVISFDKILSTDEITEIKTQYIVFSAFAYNVLGKLDYASLGMKTEQIKNLINELRAGMYDIKFKDKDNKTIREFSPNMLVQMLDSDIEFEIKMHEMEVLGLGQVNYEIREQLTKNKIAIALVEGKPLYDIYVALPTAVTQDAMNPVHEVAFRIRCSLAVNGVNTINISQVNLNTGSAQFRYKKARLFRRKKKYDWL